MVIKLQGWVMLPFGIIASSFFQQSSGTPWGHSLEVQLPHNPAVFDPAQAGSFVAVQADPPDSNRLSIRSNMDIRIGKVFRMSNFGRLSFYIDTLNALGESYYAVSRDPGGRLLANGKFMQWPNYGRVTNIYGIRVYKLSARFSF